MSDAELERAIQRCPGCMIVDLETTTRVDFTYWTLKNGMSLSFDGGYTIPLHSDFILCETHEPMAQAAWAWATT